MRRLQQQAAPLGRVEVSLGGVFSAQLPCSHSPLRLLCLLPWLLCEAYVAAIGMTGRKAKGKPYETTRRSKPPALESSVRGQQPLGTWGLLLQSGNWSHGAQYIAQRHDNM
jgi:hypothetical protein